MYDAATNDTYQRVELIITTQILVSYYQEFINVDGLIITAPRKDSVEDNVCYMVYLNVQ